MSITKKIMAGIMALAMTVALAACGDTAWSAKVGEKEIPAGIFIYSQIVAMSDAQTKIGEEQKDLPDEEKATDMFKTTVEGKDTAAWINEEATKSLQEYAAIENKFDELGLTLDDTDKNKIKVSVKNVWEQNSAILERNGISEASITSYLQNNYKRNLVFKSFYDTNGSEAVSTEEIDTYFNDNNVRVKYIAIQLKDGEGNLFKSADKQKAMTMAEDYKTRAATENFDDLIKEYDDYYADLVAKATPESSSSSDSSSVAEPEAETEVDPYLNENILSKDGTTPSEKASKAIFEKTKQGEISIVEDNEVYYVVQRLDLLERTDLLEENHQQFLQALRGDTFDELVKTWADALTVVKNDAAYKRYTPQKIDLTAPK